jgi:hypothetical protein|tara:strand:+ start:410 stop:733 length:324 start_codon:yes stop_codon:yes gene_type:complete
MNNKMRNFIIIICLIIGSTVLGIMIAYFNRAKIPDSYIEKSKCPLSCKKGETYANISHSKCCPIIDNCKPEWYMAVDNIKDTSICGCSQCNTGYTLKSGQCVSNGSI